MNVFDALERLRHDRDFEHVPASEATEARPGIRGKIAIMRERAEASFGLFHPLDCQQIERVDHGHTDQPKQPSIRENRSTMTAQPSFATSMSSY